jgi:hypothetical protein
MPTLRGIKMAAIMSLDERDRVGLMMLMEFAPLIFGTAGLLAIFLFFSVAER